MRIPRRDSNSLALLPSPRLIGFIGFIGFIGLVFASSPSWSGEATAASLRWQRVEHCCSNAGIFREVSCQGGGPPIED